MATRNNNGTSDSTSTKGKVFQFFRRALNAFMLVLLLICLVLMVYWDEGKHTFGEAIFSLLPEITGSLMVALVVNIFVKDMFQTQKEIEIKWILKNFISKQDKNNKRLKEIEVTEVFEKAIQYIGNAKSIHIIGTAKQDYKYIRKHPAITKYLDETIDKVKGKSDFVYRRITSVNIHGTFKNHIEELFSNNSSHNHNIEVLVLDDFIPAYTYLIIDDVFFMLSLNYSTENFTTYHYYTEDKKVITQFNNHFNEVWNRESEKNRILRNTEDFKYHLLYDKEITKQFDSIKKSIRRYENCYTNIKQLPLDELKKVSVLFKIMADANKIELNSTVDNANLIALFCKYLDELKKGDSYRTVTFYDFWKSFIKTNHPEAKFILSNKKALHNGVSISRILVVDQIKLHADDDYKTGIKRIININIAILDKYSAYEFRLYFSPSHENIKKSYYNFTIIEKQHVINSTNELKKEKILFKPSDEENVDSTVICFDFDPCNEEERQTETFVESEKRLDTINDDWSESNNLSELDKAFMRETISSIDTNDALRIKLLGVKAANTFKL